MSRTFASLKRIKKRLRSERASVFLEYTLLLGVMALAIAPVLPGGGVYERIAQELMLRMTIISLPIF